MCCVMSSTSDGEEDDGAGGESKRVDYSAMLGGSSARAKPPKLKSNAGGRSTQRLLADAPTRSSETHDASGKWIHPYNRGPRPYRKPKPWETVPQVVPLAAPQAGPVVADFLDPETNLEACVVWWCGWWWCPCCFFFFFFLFGGSTRGGWLVVTQSSAMACHMPHVTCRMWRGPSHFVVCMHLLCFAFVSFTMGVRVVWVCRYPRNKLFALVLRLVVVHEGWGPESSDIPFRGVAQRVSRTTRVLDVVFWDGSAHCGLHVYNFPPDFDPRYAASACGTAQRRVAATTTCGTIHHTQVAWRHMCSRRWWQLTLLFLFFASRVHVARQLLPTQKRDAAAMVGVPRELLPVCVAHSPQAPVAPVRRRRKKRRPAGGHARCRPRHPPLVRQRCGSRAVCDTLCVRVWIHVYVWFCACGHCPLRLTECPDVPAHARVRVCVWWDCGAAPRRDDAWAVVDWGWVVLGVDWCSYDALHVIVRVANVGNRKGRLFDGPQKGLFSGWLSALAPAIMHLVVRVNTNLLTCAAGFPRRPCSCCFPLFLGWVFRYHVHGTLSRHDQRPCGRAWWWRAGVPGFLCATAQWRPPHRSLVWPLFALFSCLVLVPSILWVRCHPRSTLAARVHAGHPTPNMCAVSTRARVYVFACATHWV